jgi:hypothetical protein
METLTPEQQTYWAGLVAEYCDDDEPDFDSTPKPDRWVAVFLDHSENYQWFMKTFSQKMELMEYVDADSVYDDTGTRGHSIDWRVFQVHSLATCKQYACVTEFKVGGAIEPSPLPTKVTT